MTYKRSWKLERDSRDCSMTEIGTKLASGLFAERPGSMHKVGTEARPANSKGNFMMAKMTQATSVDYMSRDDTGAMISFSYDCPHCRFATSEMIYVGVAGLDSLESGFETDQDCGVCDKRVTIRVPKSLY